MHINFELDACLLCSWTEIHDKSRAYLFFSSTPVEDITADNNQVVSILNIENGEIVFQALMKSFQFEKALMQEHFNEKYVHSDKYPKSTFKGKITNLEEVDFNKSGSYSANVKGELTLHGVTKEVETEGIITVEGDIIRAEAKFPIVLADHEVKIPSVVKENIAEEVETTVKMRYNLFGK